MIKLAPYARRAAILLSLALRERRHRQLLVLVPLLLGVSISLQNTAWADPQTGTVLADIVPGGATGNGRGTAFDGQNIYYTVVGNSNIYKVATNGSLLATIPVAGGVAQGGPLAWDGSTLWTMNYSSPSFTLYRVNPADGSILSSCNIATQNPTHPAVTSNPRNIGEFPDGLDWTGSTLWVSSEVFTGNWVVEVDTTCNILNAFNPPANLGQPGASGGTSGVAFDGVTLWHPTPTNNSTDMLIFQTDTSGTTTGLTFVADRLTEDLAFDSVTFAPVCALWGNEATFGLNHITAYEVPCPFKTPGEKAAEFAKEVVDGDYRLGARGVDWQDARFVEPNEIKSLEYRWHRTNFGLIDNVLDCSGLVFWSYNKAAGTTIPNSPGSPVRDYSADFLFRNNTIPVTGKLEPGDLLFFDFTQGEPKDPTGRTKPGCKPTTDQDCHEIDHVAMYVGCNQDPCAPGEDDVVHATFFENDSERQGIISDKQSFLTQLKRKDGRLAFIDFGRVTKPKEGIRFQAGSPVGLIVTDPDGFAITPDTLILTEREELREIPGELYYTLSGIDSNSNPNDVVIGPVLKTGVYLVQVEPKPNAAPTDTYSLKVETVDSIITLALDVPISDIPSEGYGIKITGGDITQITAIVVDIKPGEFPNSINPKSKGVISVAILTTDTFDATTVDPLSTRFGPNKALEAHGRGHNEDVDRDGDVDLVLHFKTQETGIKCGNTHVAITGKTTDGQEVAGLDSIQMVGCK